MHLRERFTPFLTLTEIWNSGIVPKAAVQSMGDDKFAQAPVSSGPFRLVEWKKGDRLILEKNPNYYRAGMPYLDGLELIYVPDDNTRVSMLQAGEIDVCMDVALSALPGAGRPGLPGQGRGYEHHPGAADQPFGRALQRYEGPPGRASASIGRRSAMRSPWAWASPRARSWRRSSTTSTPICRCRSATSPRRRLCWPKRASRASPSS